MHIIITIATLLFFNISTRADIILSTYKNNNQRYNLKEKIHINYSNKTQEFIIPYDSKKNKKFLFIDALSPGNITVSVDNKTIGAFGRKNKNNLGYFPIFKIPSKTKSIKISRNSKMRFDGSIYFIDQKDLTKFNLINNNISWLFLGGILFIILFNLFYFISSKNMSYLYYSLFNIFFSLSTLGFNSFFNINFFNHNIVEDIFLMPIGGLTAFFSYVFACHFININNHISRKRSYILKGNVLLIAILTIIHVIDTFLFNKLFQFVSPSIDLLTFLMISQLIAGAYSAIKKGNCIAKFYLASWIFVFLSVFTLYAYEYLSLFNDFFIARYTLLIGCSFEMIINSFGLAYKNKLVENQKNNAILEAREKQKYQNSLRILAHDLSNPITAATMSLQMVDILPNAHEKAMKAIKQMEDMIRMMREKEKESSTEAKTVNIYEAFQQTEETFSNQLREKNLKLKLKGNKKSIIQFGAHSFQFNVLNNLVSNAIKFSQKGGEILISLHEEADSHILQVNDSGSGMDEETLAKLKNKEITTSLGTDGEEGTGFGTQIMSQVLEDFNCNLDIDSQLGEGTTFTIKFPKVS